MNDDEKAPAAPARSGARIERASALPAQLGRKLRVVFADAGSQPMPERMQELLNALAAKDRTPD
jgi:hypothetical protein